MPAMPARKVEESYASHVRQPSREIYTSQESMQLMRLTLLLPPPWQLPGMALGHC